LAGFQPNDAILLPRNVHRSVLAGLILAGLTPIWCEPTWHAEWGLWGGVSPSVVEEAFKQHPHIQGIVITHPTYEGIATDLIAIATLCKTYHKRFIVDEAHGVLFQWHQALPLSACQLPEALAADAVVQSPHKTGGSLTQSAWLHIPKGSCLSIAKVQQALNHLQTTSPSYLLLASLELATTWMKSVGFTQQLQRHLLRVQRLEQQLQTLRHIALLRPHHIQHTNTLTTAALDNTRFYIRHATLTGDTVAETLETTAGLAYESCNPYGVLYISQLQHTPADFTAFANGLSTLQPTVENALTLQPIAQPNFVMPTVVINPRDAFFTANTTLLPVSQAIGYSSAETIVRCPPGIPILLPGEQIQAEHLPQLGLAGITQVSVITNNPF
jgi:arginine/lysine/ornithine decarboxylase